MLKETQLDTDNPLRN